MCQIHLMKKNTQGMGQQAAGRGRKSAVRAPTSPNPRSSGGTQRILHELHAHQIELEMQHEELRRSQAELEVSRLLYIYLYDLALVGYVTLSESSLIQQANLTVATLLGVARSVIVKKPLARFIFKEDQGIFCVHRKQLFETGVSQEFELRMVSQAGKMFWARMNISATRDPDGRPACRVVINDISAPKRVEESLQIKSLVFEASLVANSVADFNGIITEANAAFLRIWGYSHKDDVVGKPLAHFHCDPHEAAGILTTLDTLGEWEGEYVAKRKDASTFLAHGLATVLRDENGKVMGYQSAVVSITERDRAAMELRQAGEMQRDALQEQESLIHEIRHREKMSLQVISGLLRKQSEQVEPPSPKPRRRKRGPGRKTSR